MEGKGQVGLGGALGTWVDVRARYEMSRGRDGMHVGVGGESELGR